MVKADKVMVRSPFKGSFSIFVAIEHSNDSIGNVSFVSESIKKHVLLVLAVQMICDIIRIGNIGFFHLINSKNKIVPFVDHQVFPTLKNRDMICCIDFSM